VVFLVQNALILFKLRLRHLRDFIVLFVVLGLGAMVEMFEYIVTRHLPQNGVGGYDNNMQDLIANFVGGFIAIVAWRLGAWRLVGEKKDLVKCSTPVSSPWDIPEPAGARQKNSLGYDHLIYLTGLLHSNFEAVFRWFARPRERHSSLGNWLFLVDCWVSDCLDCFGTVSKS
jgi:hypothetical protein